MELSKTAYLSVLGRPSPQLRKRGHPSLYSAELEKTQPSGSDKASQPAACPNRASGLGLGSNDGNASHILMPNPLLPIDVEKKRIKNHKANVGGEIIKERKNKREELKRKYGKPKGPVDAERQFDVVQPNGAQCARSLDGTPPGRPPTTMRSVSQQTSTYWSVPETTYFPTLVDFFGRDWAGISNFMETKTSNMVRNHFAREVLSGKQWLEDRAQAAEERKSRGEPPGFQLEPIPPPKRKHDILDTTFIRPPYPNYSLPAMKAAILQNKAKPPAVECFRTVEGVLYELVQEDQSAASHHRDQQSTQRLAPGLGLSKQGVTARRGEGAVLFPYTVSEDRTGNLENVMSQRLSALGRCYGSLPSFSSRGSIANT